MGAINSDVIVLMGIYLFITLSNVIEVNINIFLLICSSIFEFLLKKCLFVKTYQKLKLIVMTNKPDLKFVYDLC